MLIRWGEEKIGEDTGPMKFLSTVDRIASKAFMDLGLEIMQESLLSARENF